MSASPRPAAADGLAHALAQRLLGSFDLRGARRVIGVAGESGSGKTVTAAALAAALDAAGLPPAVLNQDDYFHLPPRSNHLHRIEDVEARVGPQEVNLALIARHVAAFRAGEPGVVGPRVDWPGNRFLTRPLDFADAAVLVVEGTYVLGLDDLDVRVFLEATYEDTRERRRARGRDIIDPVIDHILALEHAIIQRQAERADIVIDRDFTIRSTR